MLNNVKVSPLTKISERDLWEALEDVATTLSRSSDELEREIHDIISASRYGNQDADTMSAAMRMKKLMIVVSI